MMATNGEGPVVEEEAKSVGDVSSGAGSPSPSPGAAQPLPHSKLKESSTSTSQVSSPSSSAGGEGRRQQLLDGGNGLRSASGLFGFVQYFMDRPADASVTASGAASPAPASHSSPRQQAAPAAPATESPAAATPASAGGDGDGDGPRSSFSSPAPDLELVKSEVFSDGNKSEQADRARNNAEMQRSQSARTFLKSEEYRQLFHLPPEEVLVEDFNCALQKKILLQGHMYLFERYVCFYSNIFGYEKKKVIPLKDITCVRKGKTAGVFPNAIEIISWGKKHFFASFLSRDEAYRLIINGWSEHSGHARVFLGSNYSPMSSPPSQGRLSLDSAVMSSSWQSPQRGSAVRTEDTHTPRRNPEDVPNLVPPSVDEVRDTGSDKEHLEPGDGDNSAEGAPDERLSVNESSSISTSSISPIWEPEDTDAPGLPENYKTVVESEFAVDVEEFFQLFFSDDAIGFSKLFHTKCGDDDFRCTQWAKHRHFGHARDISFRHPINFYFGPKSTYCHESQRFRIYRNSHLVLEMSQQMTDIPYGDYFRVEVRWDVERLCGKGSYHCFVRISLGVTFCKKTVWKGKIEQGTHEESKEAYTVWVHEAHAMLREIRAMAEEAGTVDTAAVTPSPEPEEDTRERVASDDTKSLELEQPVHRPEEEQRPKGTHVGEGVRDSRLKAGSRSHRWKKKGSALFGTIILISQKLWNKSQSVNFKTNKQLKLLCFLLIAAIIVLMQVGIIIALIRPPQVQYVPVVFPNNQMTASAYFGGSKGDEALSWLEQRSRHLKEEIVLAEARLQTLNHDLGVLKSHASQLVSFVDKQITSPQTYAE